MKTYVDDRFPGYPGTAVIEPIVDAIDIVLHHNRGSEVMWLVVTASFFDTVVTSCNVTFHDSCVRFDP